MTLKVRAVFFGLILFLANSGGFALAQTARVKVGNYKNEVASRAEFNGLKRDYKKGRFANIPHMMFVIDRTNDKVYYINSNRYRFHSEFARATYLSLDSGESFFQKNYINENRRFVLGTLAFQPTVEKFTYEFWEGDLVTPPIVTYAHDRLTKTFFAPLNFKPNSLRQEQISETLKGVPRLLLSDIEPESTFDVLNPGKAVGVLRLVDHLPPDQPFEREDIVIFKEVPISVTPVRGLITTRQGTPLSHINLLAKSWNIPNAYFKDADVKFRSLVNRWVTLTISDGGLTIEPAEKIVSSPEELKRSRELQVPKADLEYRELTDLDQQRAKDVIRFGAKSANLGEVAHAGLPGVVVPNGFGVPFACYAAFAEKYKIEDRVLELLNDEKFHHDAPTRVKKLAELREFIQKAEFDPKLREEVLAKAHRMFEGKGVFVRSSTNAEDLPNFNGAGLYSTVPNVKTDDALIEAIKTVWASLWNFEAFEARELARIDHLAVYPGVLIQEGVNADSAGVMITTNPFNRQDPGGVYINAKRGLGIKVVEGKRVPEQIIYRTRSDSVQVLTRSTEDTILTFDVNGGVKEVKIEPNRAVLTDRTARKLSKVATAIRRIFKGKHQDIEWLIVGEQVYIVQSRPYIDLSL
jgi:rifampicin phosphotransferase